MDENRGVLVQGAGACLSKFRGVVVRDHGTTAPSRCAAQLREWSSVKPLLIDGGFLSVPLGGALVGQSGIQDNLIGEPGAD